jgi:hypothetical protein
MHRFVHYRPGQLSDSKVGTPVEIGIAKAKASGPAISGDAP